MSYERTSAEAVTALEEALDEISDLFPLYDAGRLGQAKQIAVIARRIFRNSPDSLLKLSGIWETKKFYDSSWPRSAGQLTPHSGLVVPTLGPSGGIFVPCLGDLPHKNRQTWKGRQEWLDTIVIDDGRKSFSRGKILDYFVDKEAAHFDKALPDDYASLTKFDGIGWRTETPEGIKTMLGIEFASVRQIAFEIVFSFRPNTWTEESLIPPGNVAFGPVSFNSGPMSIPGAMTFMEENKRIVKFDRNDPCRCGLNKKDKKCHGK